MKKILLFGNYGGQNWGDEAICAGLLSALQKTKAQITVVSADPDFTKREHGNIRAVFRPPSGFRSLLRIHRLWSFVAALRAADLVIYGGGGLLQNREPAAILLWWYYLQWAKWFQKKHILVANSVGPLCGRFARFLAANAIADARFISLRDDQSQNLLHELGIATERMVAATDAVFFMRKLPAAKRRKGTLVMLRGDGIISKERIHKLFNNSAFPKPIEMVAMDSLDKYLIQNLPFNISPPSNINQLRRKIADSRLVISARLHGCLLAMNEETPFLALSAAPKITAFLSARGMKACLLPENVSPARLATAANAVLKMPRDFFHQKRIVERKKTSQILPFFLQ